MFRAAIALVALAAPAVAQHGGAHAGSFGSRGIGAHAPSSGYSRFSGASTSGAFERPTQSIPYGSSRGAQYRRIGPSNVSSLRNPYTGNRLTADRPPNVSRSVVQSHASDRDRYEARKRSFQQWYLNTYPTWPGYGYPYVIDPGFYDWGESDMSAYGQGEAAPVYPAPYPDEDSGAPSEQLAPASLVTPSAPRPEQPLTVIFKSGAAPVKVQNYLMTAKIFTDLDPGHYMQISLDRIDLAATQRINSAAGVDFQVPAASRD